LGSGNQCPVARFGVLTTALLKIKGVLEYYARVLVNKAVIFRVYAVRGKRLGLFDPADEGIATLREVHGYLKVSHLITSRYGVPQRKASNSHFTE
jgi:hypothetical protein